MTNLEPELSLYQQALDSLPSKKTDDYRSKVMSILIARDDIALALSKNASIDGETYTRIVDLDNRLKSNAGALIHALGEDAFIHLREARQKDESAWWWFIDKRVAEEGKKAAAAQQSRQSLWAIVATLCVGVSVNLFADTVKRFFSGGADWLSTVNSFFQPVLIVVNAGLGVLALGTLSDSGRQWADKLLAESGLFKKYSNTKRLLVAAGILVLAVALKLSLPFVARSYVNRGTRYLTVENNQSRAIEDYRRAISLSPDNPQAHYCLGTAYERSHTPEDDVLAINEYKRAAELDTGFLEAQNNLARLYLWRGKDKDFDYALAKINAALNLSPSDPDVEYTLLKNRGWANYELGQYAKAETDLVEALQTLTRANRSERAAPHCLLGFVLEAQRKKGAAEEWDDCALYSCGEEQELALELRPNLIREARAKTNIICPK